jgi:hypothetical protein
MVPTVKIAHFTINPLSSTKFSTSDLIPAIYTIHENNAFGTNSQFTQPFNCFWEIYVVICALGMPRLMFMCFRQVMLYFVPLVYQTYSDKLTKPIHFTQLRFFSSVRASFSSFLLPLFKVQ